MIPGFLELPQPTTSQFKLVSSLKAAECGCVYPALQVAPSGRGGADRPNIRLSANQRPFCSSYEVMNVIAYPALNRVFIFFTHTKSRAVSFPIGTRQLCFVVCTRIEEKPRGRGRPQPRKREQQAESTAKHHRGSARSTNLNAAPHRGRNEAVNNTHLRETEKKGYTRWRQ